MAKIESQAEALINLDALSFDFCEDDQVRNYYETKLGELADKDKWLEDNQEQFALNSEKIAKAVQDGLIADSEPETIWQFQLEKATEGQEKVLAVKRELESRVDEIKAEVAKRLDIFLPDWNAGQATIVFTMNERADFCIDSDIITVDLSRLSFEQNPLETVKEGITHEIFHLWTSEKSGWSDSKQNEVSDQTLRERG